MVLTVLLIALIVCVPKERLQVAEPIDGDQDGFVNLDDVTGYTAKLFRRMDSRDTGRLTEDKYCGEIPAGTRLNWTAAIRASPASTPTAMPTLLSMKSKTFIG